MAMVVGQSGGDDEIIATINTTPLVDVMLVLLIIFLITIPVVTRTVPVDLPKEVNRPREARAEDIQLAVTRSGQVFWNQGAIGNYEALVERLKQVAQQTPQPAIQIRGDGGAPYEHVGRVVLACQRAGILKIGFITEPPPRG
ncbi:MULTISPECIES: biopolymer transporter ExbD [unclassified Variovorax]|uniref:ExbD/TolR family protein n=1 Tax=unclassified Variovorax TaxID=663243 RepID=UPI002578EEFA|nr:MULTISPECIES: biopolymer transporter ExbD [unclassified Variovorax]MDM0087213.1 biopolymer transporter ExbD [Variovorax sp. J22G40]MDM0144530.1 biopolymer transporter ExbD [Variovorax sp. J2P1-31]